MRLKIEKSYLNLENISSSTLLEAGFEKEYISKIIGETYGYEVMLFSRSNNRIRDLAKLFLLKGNTQYKFSWKDAYSLPFICVRGIKKIKGFEDAEYYSLYENSKEFSFVSKKENTHCKKLFKENLSIIPCLVNRGIISNS